MLDQWKILVISDTHGRTSRIRKVTEELRADLNAIYFLGDMLVDGKELASCFPELAFLGVCGNCDSVAGEPSLTVELLGHRIYLCHGHRFHVKEGYESLRNFALVNHYDVALCGHTHIPYVDQTEELLLLNPGSVGEYYPLYDADYAVIRLKQGEAPAYMFGNVFESSDPVREFLQKSQ